MSIYRSRVKTGRRPAACPTACRIHRLAPTSRAFQDYLKEHDPQDWEKGVLAGDRVHRNDAGKRSVAGTILKCLGE